MRTKWRWRFLMKKVIFVFILWFEKWKSILRKRAIFWIWYLKVQKNSGVKKYFLHIVLFIGISNLRRFAIIYQTAGKSGHFYGLRSNFWRMAQGLSAPLGIAYCLKRWYWWKNDLFLSCVLQWSLYSSSQDVRRHRPRNQRHNRQHCQLPSRLTP